MYKITDLDTCREWNFNSVEAAIDFDESTYQKEESRADERRLEVSCKCRKCGQECFGMISDQDSFFSNYAIEDACPNCGAYELKEI